MTTRGWINDALRALVGASLVGLGMMLEARQRVAILGYVGAQRRLRRAYGVDDATPIHGYGMEQEASIAIAARKFGAAAAFATTSGSTASPKRLLYPAERVRSTQAAFIDAFARWFVRRPLRRHSFYAFGNLRDEQSVTSYLMAEARRPPYLATLQAPYRVHGDPAIRALSDRYSDVAVRLWVLVLSDPGYLYATNPSTLVAFLDALHTDWNASSSLIRDFTHRPRDFSRAVHRIAGRIASRNAAHRLKKISESGEPMSLEQMASGVHTYVCWTGGYLAPFLSRLAAQLPVRRYERLPMYSLSTETPETTPCYRSSGIAFIPIASRVLFEFLPDGMADLPENLVQPWNVAEGHAYSMVVSDRYGLRRYQTDDLFRCVGHVDGLPDLRFVRRRSLSYSFTGEKLTGAQAGIAIERLGGEMTNIDSLGFLTLIPSAPPDTSSPRYLLVHVLEGQDAKRPAIDEMAARCDEILCELNSEYRAKRMSGRLGPLSPMVVTLAEFVKRTGSGASPDAQFKFLPLYTRIWEETETSAFDRTESASGAAPTTRT